MLESYDSKSNLDVKIKQIRKAINPKYKLKIKLKKIFNTGR